MLLQVSKSLHVKGRVNCTFDALTNCLKLRVLQYSHLVRCLKIFFFFLTFLIVLMIRRVKRSSVLALSEKASKNKPCQKTVCSTHQGRRRGEERFHTFTLAKHAHSRLNLLVETGRIHQTAPHDEGSRGKCARLLGENWMGDDT